MDQGLIPRRYAKALYLVAKERGVETQVYDHMRALTAAFDSEPGLCRAIANPAVSDADKQRLIVTALNADDASAPLLRDFVKLITEHKRQDMTRLIARAYIYIYRQAKQIYGVTVTSAMALDGPELQRIHSLVNKHLPLGSTAEFSELIDPELIGGFTVSIDNELLDASVANELKQLRLKLLSH